jgi:hypothetical protein
MTTIKPPQKRLNITPKKFRRGNRFGGNVIKLAKQVSDLTRRVQDVGQSEVRITILKRSLPILARTSSGDLYQFGGPVIFI